MKSGIYQIQNLVNGKVYIGSAVNLIARRSQHFYCLKNNKHHSLKLQNAYNKYGQSNFEFSVIEFIENKHDLVKLEQYYIDAYDAVNFGYNIHSTAKSMLGFKHSEITKQKISFAVKNRKPASIETRQKISIALKGRVFKASTITKMSAAAKGKNNSQYGTSLSLERRIKISVGLTGNKNPNYGKKFTDEHKQKLSISKIGKPPWNKGKKTGQIPWNKKVCNYE